MDMKRRSSRKMFLEEQFKIKVLEIGRRHTVLDQRSPRRVSLLPPISDSNLVKVKRNRAQSIAMVNLPMNGETYGTIINGRLPVKLPNINSERKMSLQDNESHWKLQKRRVSKANQQLIVDHLRINLLRQHEKRSLDYEEAKVREADNESDITIDSNDEDTIKWLQAVRSRGPSLSTLNFHSPLATTPSRQENMFENSMDSLRSFASASQSSPTPSYESAKKLTQSLKFNESQRFPPSLTSGRPSICVSFAPATSYDIREGNDVTESIEMKETGKPKTASKKPSQLHKSISESERSVSLLIQNARRRSGLFEIPESDREPRSSSDPRSLSSTPVSFLRFQSRIGSGEKNNLSKSQEDDVYSDLPIDKVSLFAEWQMQEGSKENLRQDSANLNADDDKRSFCNEISSRGSCCSPDSRPVTATLAPPYDDSGMDTDYCDVDDNVSNEILEINDLNHQQRRNDLQQICLGNVTLSTSTLKRKVCLYLSSNGEDTDLERSIFRETSVTELREHCGKRNLDFSVVDLNYESLELKSFNQCQQSWFKIEDKNSVAELRLDAIRRCFSESVGPCFLSFFGESIDTAYPLPRQIPPFIFDGVLNLIEDEVKSIQEKIDIARMAFPTVTAEDTKPRRSERRSFALRRSSMSVTESSKSEEKIVKLLQEKSELANTQNLLSSWYLLNTNTQPNIYQLQSISCEFATFSASRRAISTNDEKKKDEERWLGVEDKLRNILLNYTDPKRWKNSDYENALLEWRSQTFKSVIEKETIFTSTLPSWKMRESCFWFHRNITDPNFQSNLLLKFVSNNAQQVQNLNLVIKNKFGYASIRERFIPWSALEQAYMSRNWNQQRNRDWLMYTDRLKTDFSTVCKTLINQAVAKYQLQLENELEEKIHQHVVFAQSLSKTFIGREEILNDIKKYLQNKKQRHPLVIYGPCGCGKSSLISRSAVRANSWLEKKFRKLRDSSKISKEKSMSCRIVFRSIGLTGDFSNSRQFLIGLCTQLQRIADTIEEQEHCDSEEKKLTVHLPKPTSNATSLKNMDFKHLMTRFQHLLKKCGRRKMPLILFIDNLDLVSADNDGKQFKWLPTKLPRFVKLVVTMTAEDSIGVEKKVQKTRPLSRTESLQQIKAIKSPSNRFKISKVQSSECLAALKEHFRLDDASVLSISGLESSSKSNLSALKTHSLPLLHAILNQMLQCGKVHLSEPQVGTIFNSCSFYPHPLAIAICVAISREWTSQTTPQQCFDNLPQRANSVDAFVNCFFRHLESHHGRPFVAAVCSYITLSLNGLTSNELLTLLSYDKNVSKWLIDLSIEFKQGNAAHQNFHMKKAKGDESSKFSQKTSLKSEKRGKFIEKYTRKPVPDLLWERLKKDLNYFLMETLSDCKLTLRWRHVVFRSVSIKRYVPTNEAQMPYHKLMARYFNNYIPTNDAEGSVENLCQPLYWKCENESEIEENSSKKFKSKTENLPSNVIVFNHRRLNESFYHYLSCRSLDDMKEDLLCNFQWLMTKMRASGFQSVISALTSVLSLHSGDKDLRLLAESLFLSRDVLIKDPTQLGGQLVGRLHNIIKKDKPLARMDPRKYPYCRQLIGQCRRSSFPSLIPSGTCLSAPGDVLFDLLLGHRDIITAFTVTTDGQRVITASRDETVKVWDLYSGCVISTLEGMPRHVISLNVCVGNNYVCVLDNSNKIQVISLLKQTSLLSLNLKGRIVVAVSGDASSLLVVLFDDLKELKVWDLNSTRLLHKIDISPDGFHLREDQQLITGKISGGNTVFFSFLSTDQAYVYNVKRAKHLHTLKVQHDTGRATITHVETSREYYVVACKRQYMRLHEMVTFELYDYINYGHVRTLKTCPEDKVLDICMNRLGSHLIALCRIDTGTVIGAWNVESGHHQHLDSEKFQSIKGYCVDLQYCITMTDKSSTLRVHNLAKRIDDKTLSRTHVKKKSSGIGQFYPVTTSSRYVVARGIDSGNITVWNIARGRCKGEAVSIERGLLEKNDVIVVKDVIVVVLSDRGITSAEHGSYQIFTTIYVYDLSLKKYTRKLNPVDVTVCPQHEYRILDFDKLLAVSPDRSHFLVWSLTDGQVLNAITPDFSKYIVSEAVAKESRDKKWKRGHVLTRKKTISLAALTNLTKKPTSANFRLTKHEQSKLIDQMLLSGDESTLLCSFYGRHVAVFDMKTLSHKHTLTNKHSMLLLHQAEITYSGSHLVHTNYDNDAKVSYITVWSLQHGKLVRRLRNEPYVCALTTSDKANKIVFTTEDNYLKVWEPYRRGGHSAIPGYESLHMRKRCNECQGTTVYLTSSANRAILFTYDISLWDLEALCVLARFSPDVPFQCGTVAMNGNLIVAGIRELENVVTLRLLSRDMDVASYGRAALGENIGEFGETKEKDSESSEDEILSE